MSLLTILISVLMLQSTDSADLKNDSLQINQISNTTDYGSIPNKICVPVVMVDKKEFEKKDFRTPADALQTQTGIALSKDGIWATSINVRGVNEQQLLYMLDGNRLQNIPNVAGTLSTVSLQQFEKVEIIKGAASVLYGSGAMGGVLNFITERPGYSNLLTVNANLQTGFSSVNNLISNSFKLDFRNDKWYLRATGSLRNAGNAYTPNGIIANSQFNDASWSVSGGVKSGKNQELIVGYNEFYGWNIGIPGNNSFLQTAKVIYDGIKRRHLYGEYVFTDISDLITKLSIRGYTQNISQNIENKYLPNIGPEKIKLPSSINSTSGVKIAANLYFNDYNTMTVGVESWVRKSETRLIDITYNASDTTVVGNQPAPLAKVINAGAFALYKKVIDPKYAFINFGLRLDYFKTSNDTLFNELFQYKIKYNVRNDLNTGHIIRMLPSSNTDFSYSAHVDFEYFPVNRNKFTLMLATAYRIASIEERYKYIEGNGLPIIGNPDLRPEKGGFSNLSYTYSGTKLYIRTDLFVNYFFDLITESQGKYTSVSGYTFNAIRTKNINKALYSGAEAEFQWLIDKNFLFYANASYVTAKDITSGKYLAQIPPLRGNFRFNYTGTKWINVGVSVNWAAKQNRVADNEIETPGYCIFNADVQSKNINLKNSTLKLMGGVENILDKAYKNHLFATRGLDFYEPGRNIFAKISWSF